MKCEIRRRDYVLRITFHVPLLAIEYGDARIPLLLSQVVTIYLFGSPAWACSRLDLNRSSDFRMDIQVENESSCNQWSAGGMRQAPSSRFRYLSSLGFSRTSSALTQDRVSEILRGPIRGKVGKGWQSTHARAMLIGST